MYSADAVGWSRRDETRLGALPASYMKDTCAMKGEGEECIDGLVVTAENHKKGQEKRRASIGSFRVRAGFGCQSEACVCICTSFTLHDIPPAFAIISRVSTYQVEVV